MGVNFSAFEIGRRALRAGQFGLNVAGQNVANVNTPGYTRQQVQLSSAAPAGDGPRQIGLGVNIEAVTSFRNRFIESRLQTETGISGRLAAKRDALAPVDAAFNEMGSGGIASSMSNFFGAFRELEASPASVPLRAVVTERGVALAAAFNSTRARLVGIRADADGSLSAAAVEANALAQKVAGLNSQVAAAENAGANASELRDQRGEAVRRLSELTGARAAEGVDGSVTLTLSDGRALVIGGQASSFEIAETPPDGLASLLLDGAPASIGDGKVRGLIEAVGEIGSQIETLDQLAATVASRVNELHGSGTDLDGNPGANFFAVPADGSAVTAANLAVSSGVRNNPRLVVASPLASASGAATVAGSIADLLTATSSQAGGRAGTFSSIYASIAADAGRGVRDAEDALATQEAILAQVNAQRDAASGVSLDEEAMNMLQYQKAFEAAARFLRIADEMTQTVISLGQ